VIEGQPEIHKIDLEAEFGSTSEKKKWEETFVEKDEYRENHLPHLTVTDLPLISFSFSYRKTYPNMLQMVNHKRYLTTLSK